MPHPFALVVVFAIVALPFAGAAAAFPYRSPFDSRAQHVREVALWFVGCALGVPCFLAICFPFVYFSLRVPA